MNALISAIVAAAAAQLLKPFFSLLLGNKFRLGLIFDSGAFPSSHSASVTALTLTIGLETQFNSHIFAVAAVFGAIVMYDAANVRYYAGKNIELTKRLIHDIEELFKFKFNDHLYTQKIKTVLGHKLIEVLGGISVGIVCSLLLHFL